MRAIPAVLLTVFIFTLILLLAGSIMIGSTGLVVPSRAVRALLAGDDPVLEYRALRTLAALVLGIGLGSSGLTLQYALRNPMADPYLLGVSTGAAFGVVLLFSIARTPHPMLVYISGLLWGFIAFLLVVGIGAYTGAGPNSLIVAGVSVNYAFFGLIVLLLTRSPEAQRFNFTWLFGTVAYTTRATLFITSLIVAVSLIVMIALSSRIYTLILGDEVAESLGVSVGSLRLASITIASIAASGLVALAGPVGFIGLAAPWAARLSLGSNFRVALAGALLLGAIASLASDIAVRIIAGGGEIPLTAVTALFGAPVLFYLSRRTGW